MSTLYTTYDGGEPHHLLSCFGGCVLISKPAHQHAVSFRKPVHCCECATEDATEHDVPSTHVPPTNSF